MIITFKDKGLGHNLIYKWDFPKIIDYENYEYSKSCRCPNWDVNHDYKICKVNPNDCFADMDDGIIGFADTPFGLMICHECIVCSKKWKCHYAHWNNLEDFKNHMGLFFFLHKEKYQKFLIK